jgi:hypothetical protein
MWVHKNGGLHGFFGESKKNIPVFPKSENRLKKERGPEKSDPLF